MSAKAILIFCAQALLAQSALSQCTSRAAVDASGFPGPYGRAGLGLAGPYAYDGLGPYAYGGFAGPAYGLGAPFAYGGCGAPFGYDGLPGWAGRGFAFDGVYAPSIDFTPTSGGGLTVTSASAIPPTGISVISENAYEGILAVAGEVPFVGSTGVDGVVPSAGAGAVNHACGNGINAMISDIAAYAPGYAGAYAPAAIAPAAAIAPLGAYAPALAPAAAYGCGLEIIY